MHNMAEQKNIPPRNRGEMRQSRRGLPRCGACATRRDKNFDSCRFGCGFLRCGGYRRTMAGKNPRPGDRDGVCGEPISSRGRPHKSNRHCTESGKSDHESGGCTERRCPCCPRRQPCRGCTHGRWLSRKRQRFRPWLRPA